MTVKWVCVAVITLSALTMQSQVQAANEDAFGVELAELCRILVQSDEPIADSLLDHGFAVADGTDLDTVAGHMSYRRRLERAAGSTYVPDPANFPAEKNRTLSTLNNLRKISFTSVLIHPGNPNYYVETQEKPKRACSFTYVGGMVDWPQRLGFTQDNSISFEKMIGEGRNLSMKITYGPNENEPDLGILVVAGPSLNAGSIFGGTEFIARWSVSR